MRSTTLVEDLAHCFLTASSIMQTFGPVFSDVFFVRERIQRRDPGGGVDSIGDMRDRYFVDSLSRQRSAKEPVRLACFRLTHLSSGTCEC